MQGALSVCDTPYALSVNSWYTDKVMQHMYKQIIDYILLSGKRIKTKSGLLADIGVTKKYLTEEDLAIERGFLEIIKTFGSNHSLFAEEEHDTAHKTDHIWSVDPISGTAVFIKGLPHYAIVVSHIYKGDVQFATVYDPSVDELFTAYKNGGAFLNKKSIHVAESVDSLPNIAIGFAPQWRDNKQVKTLWTNLYDVCKVRSAMSSIGVIYGYIACGRYDGVITLSKDVFPEYAGSLLIREAGGVFTTGDGNEKILPQDRVFIAGSPQVYPLLQKTLNGVNL
jgi:myo-inositol-1(or 4)-monophosphatase